jgi:hypothetical protein
MKQPETRRLSWEECRRWLEDAPRLQEIHWTTDPVRHRIEGWVAGREQRVMVFRPPLPWPVLPGEGRFLPEYMHTVGSNPEPYVLFLFQAGAAAMGYFEEGIPVLHKAMKKYVRRASQGQAQIYFLKRKGKSKAGSRLRLNNQQALFEEVNERLTEWMEEYNPRRILYSCNPTLWGMLFSAKPEPPFDRKDPRLGKVPFDVQEPDFEELQRINRLILTGELTIHDPEVLR